MSDDNEPTATTLLNILLVIIGFVLISFGGYPIYDQWEEIRFIASIDPTRSRIDILIEEFGMELALMGFGIFSVLAAMLDT